MESDPLSGGIAFQLLFLVFLTAVNAFFAGAEMAVVSVNKNKIHRLAEQGNKNAALIERLMEDSTVFLSTIQVAITLAGFFSSASAALRLGLYVPLLVVKLRSLRAPPVSEQAEMAVQEEEQCQRGAIVVLIPMAETVVPMAEMVVIAV